METELLKLLLPPDLVDQFELIRIETMSDGYHLFLDQRNQPPHEFQSHRLESKGFVDQAILRDFPLRGKACFLHLRRRKWYNHTTGKTIYSSWDSVAEGTRLTSEFAAFLKEFNR